MRGPRPDIKACTSMTRCGTPCRTDHAHDAFSRSTIVAWLREEALRIRQEVTRTGRLNDPVAIMADNEATVYGQIADALEKGDSEDGAL